MGGLTPVALCFWLPVVQRAAGAGEWVLRMGGCGRNIVQEHLLAAAWLNDVSTTAPGAVSCAAKGLVMCADKTNI
jgi:hypothetical protein